MKRKIIESLNPNKLTFIGMADTAGYWWCAMRSLLKNKHMEDDYYSAYLEDRAFYENAHKIRSFETEDSRVLCSGKASDMLHIKTCHHFTVVIDIRVDR